jgi:hypothetical protein
MKFWGVLSSRGTEELVDEKNICKYCISRCVQMIDGIISTI